MRKVLGILTEDFRLYHDLVAALKTRDLPFVSLSFSRRVPENVGAVLTSPSEAGKLPGRRTVPVEDVDVAIARAAQILRGRETWREVVVGIDPGQEPGVAVLGDGEVLDRRIAPSPEAVARIAARTVRAFPADRARVRVGDGDPTNRNRIINALSREGLDIEIVDERGTTTRSPQPDLDAAIRIALTPGVRSRPFYEIAPTEGELREIQRRSRLRSGGRVTISRGLAAEVAKGETTLGEAVERQGAKDRSR